METQHGSRADERAAERLETEDRQDQSQLRRDADEAQGPEGQRRAQQSEERNQLEGRERNRGRNCEEVGSAAENRVPRASAHSEGRRAEEVPGHSRHLQVSVVVHVSLPHQTSPASDQG